MASLPVTLAKGIHARVFGPVRPSMMQHSKAVGSRDSSCSLCGHDSHDVLFKVRDLNYQTTDEEFSLVRCAKCGLVFLNPRPENLSQYYPKEYLPYQSSSAESPFKPGVCDLLRLFYHYPQPGGHGSSFFSKVTTFHRFLDIKIKERYFFYRIPYGPDKKILDLGCGNGNYLRALKALGWRAATQLYGTDLPSERLKSLREVEQVNIIEGKFLEVELLENCFDVVTLRHVLEHLEDPVAVMRKIAHILRPGGRVLINVPNFKSVEAQLLFRETWRHIDAPRHLYHYTPGTMRKLLQDTGFLVEKIILKRSSSAFMRSLERSGRTVPHSVEKYVIRNLLKLFALFGYSGELLCMAVKR